VLELRREGLAVHQVVWKARRAFLERSSMNKKPNRRVTGGGGASDKTL
jgi:hypothetical protein